MRWSILILICVTSLAANAQDWIVKTSGEKINCKIIEDDALQLTFTIPPKKRKYYLPKSEIERYEISNIETLLPKWAIEQPKLSINSYPVGGDGKKAENRDKGFRIGLVVGFSYLLAPVSDATPSYLEEHVKRLKSGFNVKADVVYFFGKYFGMGPKYSVFKSRASTKPSSGLSYYTYTNDVALHFVAGHFTSRFMSRNRGFRFMGGVSIGYISYRDKHDNGFRSSTLTAETFGFSLDFDLDFRIYKSLSFGVALDFINAVLSEDSYHGTQNGEPNNLTRVDLSGGLRVYL